MKTQITAIFGVSAGAMAASYRAAGREADTIYKRLVEKNVFNMSNINIPPITAIIKDKPVRELFTTDLPSNIEDLTIPIYIGVTDLKKGEYHLFNKGKLVPILMGSVSLPIIFPPVEYKEYLLVDGGVMNNFPVDIAKKRFPTKEIIGITMSQFKENQPVKSIISMTQVCFNLMFTKKVEENKKLTDHLFYKNTGLNEIDNDPKKIYKGYLQGYKDGMTYFTPLK
jgi:NTE family protein